MRYKKAIVLLIPLVGAAFACGMEAESLKNVPAGEQEAAVRVYAKEREESKKIAVVNLDEGISGDGRRMSYAEKVLRFPSAEFEYASLETARNGIRSGRYGAYIIIPAVFSRNVESINDAPQVSQLEYAINKSYSGEGQYELLYSVLSFVDSLNNNLSYMYVNNVLKEFHKAQDHAESIMENDLRDKAAIDRIKASDLVALVEIPEMEQEENPAEDLDLSGYTAKDRELAYMLDEEYKDCVHDVQSQIESLRDGGAVLSEVLEELSGQVSQIDLTVDEDGEPIAKRADALLEEELNKQRENALDRKSLARQLTELKSKNEELKHRWEQSNRIYNTDLNAELESIRKQYLSDIRQNLPALQLEYDPQGNLILTFENSGQEEEPPSVVISCREGSQELTYSGDPSGLAGYIRERCEPSDEEMWQVTQAQGLLYDDNDMPQTDAEGRHRMCSSLADDSTRQIERALSEVEEAKDLDAERIRDLVREEYTEPMERNAQEVKEAFHQRYQEEADSVAAYKEELGAFAPQASDGFVTRNMDEMGRNHQLMQEALTENNLAHQGYADRTAENAREHVKQLKEHIREAKERSDEAVEDGLGEARRVKEETSMANQHILEKFARKLSYTRLGSAENTQVYQFMANPVMSADRSEGQTAADGVARTGAGAGQARKGSENSRLALYAVSGTALSVFLAQMIRKMRRRLAKSKKGRRKRYGH